MKPVSGLRRAGVVGFLAVLLGAGVVADRRPSRVARSAAAIDVTMPAAAPTAALSSTWYCAGATATPDGAADGAIVVANPAARPVAGSVTIVPVQGEARTVALAVPAFSRTVVRHQDVVKAPYAAALVELDGGDAVVEHSVNGPLGASLAPCASSASDHWYFAEGSTAREDSMLLALYNPFPEDAIADLSFSTDQGSASPSDFKGIVVRAGSVNVLNIGDHVRRRETVATTVDVRRGRMVADRIQLRGSGPRKGITLALGAPSAGSTWYFPDGLVGEGQDERYQIYNPSPDEAQVDVEMTLDEGAAEPFEITVPPRQRTTLVVSDEDRIPDGVGHSAIVRAINDVAVVVERTVTAAPPSGRQGVADTLGARRSARRWALAAGSVNDASDEWVTVQNVSGHDAAVSASVFSAGGTRPVETVRDVVVPAGGRQAFKMSDHVRGDDLGLVVTASEPVVVERALYRLGAFGLSSVMAIPLR